MTEPQTPNTPPAEDTPVRLSGPPANAPAPEPPAQGDAATPPEPAAPEPKYTDADLDKYKGSARKEGRQAALNELLGKAQGAGSAEDLIAAWQEKQMVEQAAQTEAERLQAELAKTQAERDEAAKLAKTRLVEAELRTRLIAQGVPADGVRLQDAMAVVDRSALEVGNDDKVTGVEEAVTAALEPRPWLTAGTEPEPASQPEVRTAVDATPRSTPKLDPATMTDDEIRELADRVTRGGPVPVTP